MADTVVRATSGDASGGDAQTKIPTGCAAKRYAQLTVDRESYLIRARNAASLTVPYLFRENGDNGTTDQPIPWSSLGAWLLLNLTGKVALALFPADLSPFKLVQALKSAVEMEQLKPDERASLKLAIDKGLQRVEQQYVEASTEDGDGAVLFLGIMRTICGGTQGYRFYPDGKTVGIPLDRFVCVRDGSGELVEFVVVDNLVYATVDPEVQSLMCAQGYVPVEEGKEDKPVQVYTHGCLDAETGKWKVYQEVWSFEVPNSKAIWNKDALPFLFDPWILLEGEHYGRSHVESYEADLQSVEGNTQSVTEGAAAISRFVRYVNPTGLTSRKAVAEAVSGDVIPGREDDVSVEGAKWSKAGDFQAVINFTDRHEARLAKGFLVTQQRQAERVTKEEVRQVAQDLEEALGGIYSQQVVSLQAPFVARKFAAYQRTKRVNSLPKGTVSVKILGGLAAMGRSRELQALEDWLGGSIQLLGPQVVMQALGPAAVRQILQRRATALGVDTEGLIPTEEAAQQNDQQQMMMQLVQQLGPNAISALGANATGQQVAGINAQNKLDVEAAKQGAPPQASAPPSPETTQPPAQQ